MEPNIYTETIWKLLYTCRHHRYSLNAQLQNTGVFESQHRLLMNISNKPDFTQKELAESMQISPATLAVTLKKLEKGGYVKRQMDDRDNRCNRLVLTERGKEVVEVSHKVFSELDRMFFKDFAEDEILQLGNYLDRICCNLDEADKMNLIEHSERSAEQ